ncbi:MAG: MFS transporter [Desulfurococcaceae archaeon]
MEFVKKFAFATFINSIAWGLLFSFSTRYIAIELSGGTDAVVIYLGLSWLFTLMGLLSGKVARLIGEKNSVLMGSWATVPILLAIFAKDSFLVAFLLSITAFPWVISWSIVLKILFSATPHKKAGLEYGKMTIGSGLGYFVGSIIQGFVYNYAGVLGVYALASIMVLSSYFAYYRFYPGIYQESNTSIQSDPIRVTKKILIPLFSVMFSVFIREFLYAVAPSKLNQSIEEFFYIELEWVKYTIYGIIFSGGTLISPFIRVLAGKLVDKYGSFKIFILTVFGYTILFYVFNITHGLAPIILWQIPLFPFLDIASNVYIASRLSNEEMIIGFGVLNSFIAIGGSLIISLSLIGEVDIPSSLIIVSIVSMISIALIYHYEKGSTLIS